MSYDIECPVCDRKASANATVCPYCGADLKMASFDDLEEVAVAISAGKPSPAKSDSITVPPKPEVKPEPASTKAKEVPDAPKTAPKPKEAIPEPKAEEGAAPEKAQDEKKEEGKHGLGRFFGKKKK